MNPYIVCRGKVIEALVVEVEENLFRGYLTIGGLSVYQQREWIEEKRDWGTQTYFCQAMIFDGRRTR